jgi:hypothetical protein
MLKQSDEADGVDAQRVAIWRDRPPAELASLALKQTSRAALIAYGKPTGSPTADLVRELDLGQAATSLRDAIANGFTDLRMLKSHPDAALLLSRDDVKSAIRGLE